jgi:hypothetical protein
MPAASTAISDASRRPIVASGIAFSLLFTAGFIALSEISGSFGDSNATFIEYYASSDNRARDIAGMYLMTGAALAATAVLFVDAVMAAATVGLISLKAWTARVLPRWICIFGFVASALLVLLAYSGPHLLFLPAWVLAASIAVARSARPQPAADV